LNNQLEVAEEGRPSTRKRRGKMALAVIGLRLVISMELLQDRLPAA
jgi:hypothetical protein